MSVLPVSCATSSARSRTRGHDTGDAQWFVNLRDNGRLDGDYTVWGEVVEGIDVVDAVLQGDRVASVVEIPGTRR